MNPTTVNLTPAQLEKMANSLTREVAGEVFLDVHRRALYGTDASLYQIRPLAVVVPKTVADVAVAVRTAAEFGVPITPRGGGTSLSGQSIGPGLVLDFSKYLNRILELDPESRTARVQPGVVLDVLNAAAARFGLGFGPDVATSSRANLGGMIGNNSAGARSILHGKTVDHVISLEVLLSDGTAATFGPLTATEVARRQSLPNAEGRIHRDLARIVAANRDQIVARYPRILRRVSGYNLDEFVPECRGFVEPAPSVARVRRIEQDRYAGAEYNVAKLVVGAEGTLACVTEAVVHLVPVARESAIAVLHFQTLADAVASLGTVLECGPSAAELFDGMILGLAEKSLEYRHYLDFVVGRPESLLLVEMSGDSPGEVRDKVAQLASCLGGWPGLSHTLVATDPDLRNHVWACRKAALPLLMGLPGSRKPLTFVEDTAVAPARLPEFVARFREILAREGTTGAFYGHASVGCLHIRPLLDAADREDLLRLERISRAVCELVIEFGGAMSAEHGDGLARSYLNERLFGSEVYGAFRQIKAAFDPSGLMNPGKVVDGPSPIESLRQGADYRRMDVETVFDFSREGGLARAAELCNGSAMCRKTVTGTMCPSFMVTGDEEHSTRGRANALRLVLSGALPPEELTGPRLFETFSLCLQCKGCKAECPSNVDVAKLKGEFLDRYWRRHGAPLGIRVMGHAAKVNRLGSALAPLSNWALRMPGAAWLGERLLGVDRRRPLPKFYRDHFRKWFRHRPRPQGDFPRGPVVLLDDCLTSYCDPEVNRAAVRVLEAAGYEVHLAGLECCGRTLISKGLLREAKQLAQANIARLLPWAERGIPIVGCEPSCILTLLDEYLDLAPGPAARAVADHARTIDTHLARAGIALPLAPHAARVLLHGHCQQKALVGAEDTRRALTMIPGVSVELLDSGCCGLAGSFGYEHYDLSIQIGERVLFPAVRKFDGAAILAPGMSCRHQIEHGTGRRALHPIQFLAEHLA
ncbi:MAG: FAD-binding and (Fe-S)-binding domain-containing protein [Pirellulales bacterium]